MSVKLKDTLNLPQTDFAMRGDLAKREPEHFAMWDKINLYQQTLENRAGAESYILHDGPPYANGNIHMGHALNKILKDFVIRYKSMRGYRTPYVPGWDCHGLPIEQQILRQIGDRLHDMEAGELRNLCHRYALEWIDKQRGQFKRLGILGDWDKPYSTVDPVYEVGILKVLLALVEKGLIRKGHKVVHWDPVFRTALAEAEIEYHPHVSPSIYVAMPLLEPQTVPALEGLGAAAIVIWTTTPWTLPANMGISLHPEFNYVAIQLPDQRCYIVAEGLLESFAAACSISEYEVVRTFKATELEHKYAAHPIFSERSSLIMLGEHVTLEQGTGCVHTAPGHGAEDFEIGNKYGLEVFCPVDEKGCYTSEFPELAGTFVFAANPKVIAMLRASGLLLAEKQVEHDYPHSDRGGSPILFRATEQWFMALADGGLRENALDWIENKVEWIPHWGKDRIAGMVERRPEWCISRQRNWGVPIPSIRSRITGKSELHPDVLRKFIEAVAVNGTDAWYNEPLAHFLPDGYAEDDYEKEFDILDVWFDSGASHMAVLEQDERLHGPADLYLEGSDQHRGWFQHALLTSIGACNQAPFKSVLTHGFVLDKHGKAMSKSKGNVISPLDLIDQFGADILRLWVASTDYRNDVSISTEIVKITADTYRTIRNTLRFQMGNLHDFDPSKDAVVPEQLSALDRWALHQLAELMDQVTEAFDRFEFHRVYQLINKFFTVTLSARYHDFLKDRLYTFGLNSHARRCAQTVIHCHFNALVRMLAPFLAFTCDEAYAASGNQRHTSVHLEDWPQVPESWRAPQLATEINRLMEMRDVVNEKLEALRGQKEIGKSIEASIAIHLPPESAWQPIIEKHHDQLAELFIVSNVSVHMNSTEQSIGEAGYAIVATVASGERCPRCWRTVETLVQTEMGAMCPRCAEALGLAFS